MSYRGRPAGCPVRQGAEGAAREARYAALARCSSAATGSCPPITQTIRSETLLLNLLRGSGPDGLAAMPEFRKLGDGWLVRPFLSVTREMLAETAAELELAWIDDPSNAGCDFDRNYLRRIVLPRIAERWPDSVQRLSRSVERQQDASALLAEVGYGDVMRSASLTGSISMDSGDCRPPGSATPCAPPYALRGCPRRRPP